MSKTPYNPDTLADRLDALLPPNQPDQISADDDSLTRAAAQLASAAHPALSPEALARIQAQVVQAAEAQRFSRPRATSRPLLRWALTAGIALVILFTASVPGALASVPGDLLYPVKNVIESVELGLATSPEAQVGAYLTFAERRVSESEALAARGVFDQNLVGRARESLALAASITQAAGLDERVVSEKTAEIEARIDGIVQEILPPVTPTEPPATEAPVVPPTIAPTHTSTAAATMTPTVTATATPTASATPTLTTTASPTPTVTATVTATLTVTATETAIPVDLIIEGPVQAINEDSIVIYDIEIEIDPDDPLLIVIRIGDNVRIEGDIIQDSDGGTVTIRPIVIRSDDDALAISPDGQDVWRDTGDCANPPPDWAVANGWRARCRPQAAPPPAGGGGNNQGNQGNNNRRNQQSRDSKDSKDS